MIVLGIPGAFPLAVLKRRRLNWQLHSKSISGSRFFPFTVVDIALVCMSFSVHVVFRSVVLLRLVFPRLLRRLLLLPPPIVSVERAG